MVEYTFLVCQMGRKVTRVTRRKLSVIWFSTHATSNLLCKLKLALHYFELLVSTSIARSQSIRRFRKSSRSSERASKSEDNDRFYRAANATMVYDSIYITQPRAIWCRWASQCYQSDHCMSREAVIEWQLRILFVQIGTSSCAFPINSTWSRNHFENLVNTD